MDLKPQPTATAQVRPAEHDDRRDAEPPGLYPVALKLAGERCVVIGGGVLALRKTEDLLACGAAVHAVAPQWREEFDELAAGGRITRITREFEPGDLDGAALVIGATDDPAVQQSIADEARRRGIPHNVVDVNYLCSFYVPAVLRRGALTVAVTTDGKFPLLAVALRDRFAAKLGEHVGAALERLAEAREHAFAAYPNRPEARVAALRALLTERAVDWIVEGRLDEFEAHYVDWKSALPERT